MSDFPLTFNRPPELEACFLVNVVELKSEILRTNTRNSIAEELVMAFQKGIKSVFQVAGRRASFHFCHRHTFSLSYVSVLRPSMPPCVPY